MELEQAHRPTPIRLREWAAPVPPWSHASKTCRRKHASSPPSSTPAAPRPVGTRASALASMLPERRPDRGGVGLQTTGGMPSFPVLPARCVRGVPCGPLRRRKYPEETL